MKIGILDIQGSVDEHLAALPGSVPVKCAEDLEGLDGLVLPGGESTTMNRLIDEDFKRAICEGNFALWGTCAGAILLSQWGMIDIEIERNGYGRQIDSFETEIEFDGKKIPAVFIRAPRILKCGNGVEVLAEYNGEAVAVRQGPVLATCFHPELTESRGVQECFLELCSQ